MVMHYAWYSLNSGLTMHPVGWLKPNRLGLFDMHGNASQWCQEVYAERGNKEITDVINDDSRVLRGGSFHADAWYVRSASRGENEPAYCDLLGGIRVARTYH
jgi:formylglycine-generating enzyme required for sulfatase activity